MGDNKIFYSFNIFTNMFELIKVYLNFILRNIPI